jgi:hypothetical protein
MDPDFQSSRRCDRCGGQDDLYLLTPVDDNRIPVSEACIRCGRCRGNDHFDVAVPTALLTPRLLLGLQRLGKLHGNLGRLLASVQYP